MKYMLLIYGSDDGWGNEEWAQCTIDSSAICRELEAKGQFLTASPLHPASTAKSVRVREGKKLITDGPFAETTEQLGGYYIIDVENLDEAIAIASRLPPAKKGTVEIRPIYILENLPPDQLTPLGAPSTATGTRYMFLCYDDAAAWEKLGKAAHHAAMMEAVELTHKLAAKGQYLSASPLHPTSTATSVRIRDGKRSITDGPFAETREFLGGFYLIRARDMAEALAYASRHSGARLGTVEVRQIFEMPQ